MRCYASKHCTIGQHVTTGLEARLSAEHRGWSGFLSCSAEVTDDLASVVITYVFFNTALFRSKDIMSNKRAVLKAFGTPYEVELSSIPSRKPGFALVRLTHSGCCFTDTKAHSGENRQPDVAELVGGHEGIGTVVEIEDGHPSGLVVGQRVGMGFLSSTCEECEMCLSNDEAYCPNQTPTGFDCDGTFQQYAVFKANYLIPIPDELESETCAPLLCAGATVFSGLKASRLQPGQWVAIPGAGGGLGHIAVQYARAMGGRVIGIDAGGKRDLPLSLGAEHFVDYETESDVAGAVEKLTGGGAHVTIVTSIHAYPDAWKLARVRGTIVAIGMGVSTFDATMAVIKGFKVLGTSTSSRAEAKEALAIAAKKGIRPVVEIRGMADIERTMQDLNKGAIKGRVVIDLDM